MTYYEAKTFTDTFQRTRDLTKWYLSLLKSVDAEKEIQIGDKKLNSIYWISAHLVWAEKFLLVQGTGGNGVDIPWLEHYKLGSDGTLHEGRGDFKSILDALKIVHENAMQHLLTLDDETLQQPNPVGFGFGGDNSNRMMVMHAIRHEGTHVGHLGWLCKLHGIDTV
ncbi:MAG: DinB family protein [Bacteroidetes bacterium]|nr:DinB family protein [Bacteroidota bacterium]